MKRRGLFFGCVVVLLVGLYSAEIVHADALRIGIMQAQAGDAQAVRLTLCNEAESARTARQIIIRSTGRPRSVGIELESCP